MLRPNEWRISRAALIDRIDNQAKFTFEKAPILWPRSGVGLHAHVGRARISCFHVLFNRHAAITTAIDPPWNLPALLKPSNRVVDDSAAHRRVAYNAHTARQLHDLQ